MSEPGETLLPRDGSKSSVSENSPSETIEPLKFSPIKECRIEADLVFVSDVHMRDADDSRFKTLLEVAAAAAKGKVGAFVLGGDIAEYFWAKNSYFHRKFDGLAAALKLLSEAGTKVFFIQGNHEFCFQHLNWPGVTALGSQGATLVYSEKGEASRDASSGASRDASGASEKVDKSENEEGTTPVDKQIRIGVSHGDLIAAPKEYLKYLSVVHSSLFIFFFSLVPSFLVDKFALWFAKRSRDRDNYSELVHRKVLNAASELARTRSEHAHVFGHFHYPYQAEDGVRLICDSDWSVPNAVVFRAGNWQRLFFKKNTTVQSPIVFKSVSEYENG